MTLETIQPNGWAKAKGYANGMLAENGTLHIGGQTDIARLTWFITDKTQYLSHQREIGAAYRNIFGKHFPAMSVVVVKELIEDDALIEIEATAHIKQK